MCTRLTKYCLILLLAGISYYPAQCQFHVFEDVFSKPLGFVSDYEGDFSREQILSLDSLLRAFENQTTNEIAVVSIKRYSPYETLFDYSMDLFFHWGVGKKGKDNGVLIVFSRTLDEVQIQAGVGMKEKIDSLHTVQIINEIIEPEFSKQDYFSGIKNGLLSIISKIIEEEDSDLKIEKVN